MSFNTALSGLQSASVDLSVTSNNIANVSTTGFKYSRGEFGDVFAVSPFGNSPTAVGNGVQVDNVSQQFGQGNLKFTDASLDMAISGQGYFVVSQDIAGTDLLYSRAGEFRVNKDSYIVNNDGRFLQTFPVDNDGNITSSSLNTTTPVQLPASTGTPSATTEVEIGVNLPASDLGKVSVDFDPSQSTSYNSSTSTTVFDSLGDSHVMTYYFVKDPTVPSTNTWDVYTFLDGNSIDVTGGAVIANTALGNTNVARLTFNNDGSLNNATPSPPTNTAIPLANGANALTIAHDFTNNITTQYSAGFSVNTLNADGFTTGNLTGIDISEEGLIQASYSNGVAQPLGKIAMADFPNSQGLANEGSSAWTETVDSGAVITGEAGTGRFGLIQSGALESSNVDLTAQLVNLITAQRNFQANAKSIETANTLTQTIIQIR
ncbi:MAG: flagellar hook protein FlgE [Gammaproteobacteria bacterium]|nr:flagellar hook protein FlgE [Gammaproteobacteria bacterium]